jgi:hypothetical protein
MRRLKYSITPERQLRNNQMGKPMYNFGKNAKEKARQLKQTEKTAKRLAARKQKSDMANIAVKEAETIEPQPGQDSVKGAVDTHT